MKKEMLNIQGDRALIRKILAVGQEFDLNSAGLYDAGSGAVQIWCSPEDKPQDWDKPITPGGLNYPRELVGALEWDWLNDDQVEFYVVASPYALIPTIAKYYSKDCWNTISEVMWQKVMVWLKRQALSLIRLAQIHETYLGMGCPLCAFVLPANQLINDLLSHIVQEHGEIQSISLGKRTIFHMADGQVLEGRTVTDVQQ